MTRLKVEYIFQTNFIRNAKQFLSKISNNLN